MEPDSHKYTSPRSKKEYFYISEGVKMSEKVKICTSLDWQTLRIIEGVQKRYSMTRNSAISYIVKSWDEDRKKASGTSYNPERR